MKRIPLATLAATILFAAPAGAQALEPYTDSVPGTVVTFNMVPVPGGRVVIDGTEFTVPDFWMLETEVPWELYDVFALKLDVPRSERLSVDAETRPSNPYGAPDHGYGHRGYAAISITYQAATAFSAWLSEKTGHEYRVPTDAEWTRAVQANYPDRFDLDAVAWYADNAGGTPHPVGSKGAGALGLHDMLGNVLEWVTAPDGPLARGGSFRDPPDAVQLDSRARQDPSWNSTDPQIPKSRWWLSDGFFVGFRIVRVPGS